MRIPFPSTGLRFLRLLVPLLGICFISSLVIVLGVLSLICYSHPACLLDQQGSTPIFMRRIASLLVLLPLLGARVGAQLPRSVQVTCSDFPEVLLNKMKLTRARGQFV